MTETLQQLHFLRPEWFYGFIPLALFAVFLLRRRPGSRSWRQVCDERLLPHLLVRGATRYSRAPVLLGMLGAGLCLIALAGPVLEKLPKPVFRDEASLIIALDLSRSMQASDLKPSRLERARLKITDILGARKGGQTALVVYAASAFTVTPLTDDVNTIANLLPALEPELMPAQGSRADRALELARSLLRQAGVQRGDILLVTDSIREQDIDAIGGLFAAGHRLSILGVGTPSGGPIPMSGGFLQNRDGAIVIPKLDAAMLQRGAQAGGGVYTPLLPTDADVKRLTRRFGSEMPRPDSEQLELTADTWREEGPWLLLLVIPLAALWPRKGWIACLALFLLPLGEPAHALEIDTANLWSRPDQKGMQAFREGDAEKAAELFERPDWKSSALYRSGAYEKALQQMPEADSARAYYNRGNTLAKLGRYPEALQAYDEALQRQPDMEDAAFNRDLVRQQMQQQSQQQASDGQSPQQQSSQQEQQDSSSGQQQDPSQPTEPQSAQQPPEQEPEPGEASPQQAEGSPKPPGDDEDKQQDETRTPDEEQNLTEQDEDSERQQQKGEESEEADRRNTEFSSAEQKARENAENEERIATEQWLRRIPDDPGGLLRRKFLYQYRQMPEYSQQETTDEPW